jgi:hypothetical protein
VSPQVKAGNCGVLNTNLCPSQGEHRGAAAGVRHDNDLRLGLETGFGGSNKVPQRCEDECCTPPPLILSSKPTVDRHPLVREAFRLEWITIGGLLPQPLGGAKRPFSVRVSIYALPQANDRSCAGFWTPVTMKDPRAQLAGVQKAPRHEVAGSWAPAKQQRAPAYRGTEGSAVGISAGV